jgi:3-hydroxyacyl-CoA dehydrogenase
LVEVVWDAQSSPAAIADARALTKRMRKSPVLVQSCPGFLLNRIFMPYGQACGFLIDRGLDPYAIDAALEGFGMPMGPCRVSDLAGIDVGLKAGAILDEAYSDRVYRSALRALLAEAGRLGEKTGAGHYRYDKGRALPDASLHEFVREARALAGDPTPLQLSGQQICDHLLLPVVNEALRALSEGVVARGGDVDVAAILAYGFPAYRGGPLFWAAQRGFADVLAALSAMHEAYGIGVYRPSDALRRVAQTGTLEALVS